MIYATQIILRVRTNIFGHFSNILMKLHKHFQVKFFGLGGGGGFSDIWYENFSSEFEDFPMVQNTLDIGPRTRTNLVGHKSNTLE